MDDRTINHIIEDWSKTIPDAVWWVLGAVSGFIAGRVIGRTVLKISAFQHPVAAAVIALGLLVGFLLFRKKYEQLAGWCLWLGAFSIGLLTLR
jgi:hypothetical protein